MLKKAWLVLAAVPIGCVAGAGKLPDDAGGGALILFDFAAVAR
ncbi:hypothetical protein [Burkholderia sp. S-53]|nr:hypothetical protein [Burkholderia sp. S-53]